ncbi:MAG: DNA-directed RNA polymerase subunit N [Nitrososphaerota archaeon]|nr:DNA-directed RNA polymerase subunit N [Nitrososphaerales archaeon]MCX8191674.1 DNA-directed RNA polymerase subunit N [Nitrososphaerales archaeon]MDW8044635.1 DNA-directed RNA polymerase subunit N [Nitrososphaerota archaeon]
MLYPIRCFTCGALIGDKFDEFRKRVNSGEKAAKVLDDLGIKRYCCRRMLLTSVDVSDQVLPYFEALARRQAELKQSM